VKNSPLQLVPGQLELIRPPAPGQLELVRRFINSSDRSKGIDAFESPAGLLAWLRENGLAERGAKPTADDCRHAQEVREALRELARTNNGIVTLPVSQVLDEAAARSRLSLAFDGTSATLRPEAGGVDGAIGRILAAVHTAMHERAWPRLKVCADDTCAWAFYDRSKNGCSRWCSADTCGNRDKVKRYRKRQAEGAP